MLILSLALWFKSRLLQDETSDFGFVFSENVDGKKEKMKKKQDEDGKEEEEDSEEEGEGEEGSEQDGEDMDED